MERQHITEHDITEKPPSPVLCNKINRKILLSRKNQMKSRVKLTNRFCEEPSNNKRRTNEAPDETLILESQDLLTNIENVADIKQTEFVENFTFKKPETLIKYAKKRNEITLTSQLGGFKTASGKSAHLSDEVVKKSKKLFDDILNSGNITIEKQRSNKYSFLSKKSCISEAVNTSTTKESNGSELGGNQQTKSDGSGFVGFETASGITITEARAINTLNTTQEISLLSTQETNQLFSDVTIRDNPYCTKEIARNMDLRDFKGFTEDSIEESRNKSIQFIKRVVTVQEEIKSCQRYRVGLSKLHRKPQNSKFGATPVKFPKVGNNFSPKCDYKNHSGGFATASGKTVNITKASINSAKLKFGENLTDISSNNEEESLLSSQETDYLFGNITMMESQLSKKTTTVESLRNKPVQLLKGGNLSQPRKAKYDRTTHLGGFAMASGKKADITKASIDSATVRFGEDFADIKFSGGSAPIGNFKKLTNEKEMKNIMMKESQLPKKQINETKCMGFSMASGRKNSVTETSIKFAKNRFGEDFTDLKYSLNSPGFKKQINLMSSQETNDLFGNLTIQNQFSNKQITEKQFRGFTENSIKESEQKNEVFMSFFLKCCDTEETLHPTINSNRTPLQELHNVTCKVTMSKSTVKKTGEMFQNINKSVASASNAVLRKDPLTCNSEATACSYSVKQITYEKVNSGVQTGPGRVVKLTESVLGRSNLSLNNSSSCSKSTLQDNSLNESLLDSSAPNVSSSRSNKKKRLGVSHCKPQYKQIPKDKIQRVMQLLDDGKPPVTTPVKTHHSHMYNSTPLKNAPVGCLEGNITPIKRTNTSEYPKLTLESSNDRILIRDCTSGNIDRRHEALKKEIGNLEIKLKLLIERREALTVQKRFLELGPQDRQAIQSGVLFDKKQNSSKIPLKDFLQVDASCLKVFNVTPQNAEFVHFCCTKENVSTVTTLDGARVIPDVHNLIGLPEIESAFQIMRGIEPKLIPHGWIRNHFRWIVWKLVSYENFAVNMKDSLTVENVIQQLKYRYDREIDRAERSAVRKILERDDAPQKRMVLCVSNIFDMPNSEFELELMDGWYSIRACIDGPLCEQVVKRRIQIGTKLIICGAELLNCEGCHPLEVADTVRLKINYNSTRRAKWYTKLGFQKCPGPFPLKLFSTLRNGGLIGCITVYVARVYPIKYMEKQNKLTVWRNRKAEELRAQEWENKGRLDMEKFRETVRKSYEMDQQIAKRNIVFNMTDKEISAVHCPETLYNLYQNSPDPERLQEILSHSQKQTIMDYRQRLLHRQQQDMSRKIEDSLGKLQTPKREVTSVLQLLVIDALDLNERSKVFQIWRPSDIHVETIKESSVFSVLNVLPKKSGGLCTMSRTTFQLVPEKSSEFSKYRRKLLPISKIFEATTKPLFNEYDTVGIVIRVSIDSCSQNLWLADPNGSLLFIKIFEGPKNCLLLDKIKSGQSVAACNLIFCDLKLEFGEAIANHVSIISPYPQHKHLQEGINMLNEQFPKDITLFLEQCNQKIAYYLEKVDITKGSKNISSRSLVRSNSLTTSDILDDGSDVFYSMIDVDKFS